MRFVDGDMTGLSAAAVYDLDKGTLALSGSEPGAAAPHVVNEQIAVDAADHRRHARRPAGEGRPAQPVKSVLQPPKERRQDARRC